MRTKKVFIITLVSIIAITTVFTILFFTSRKYNVTSLSPNQWALYNFGQEIQGQKGKKGVDINILKAWEITKGSPEVTIGILDSGIDIKNINISNNIFINPYEIENNIDDDNNGYIDDANGWNFYGDDKNVYDCYLHDYHGTFLSGIICASNKMNTIYGVAPNSKVLPLKFLSGSAGQTEDAEKAVEYAHSLGVKIINCSWDNFTYDEKFYEIIKKFNDILFICSAGKNGNDLEKIPVYPACYDLPNIISVAAIDNTGKIYNKSGYGKKAHVAAPGVDIYSIMPEGDFIYSSGTSAATAYVAGIAALIKSYKPNLSSIQIAEIIKKGVKPLKTLKYQTLSEGIIDAYKCLKISEKY